MIVLNFNQKGTILEYNRKKTFPVLCVLNLPVVVQL